MTAEVIYRFIEDDPRVQTNRIVLVDSATLAERMAATVAINAIDKQLQMLDGKEPNWQNNAKYTPEDVEQARLDIETKLVAAEEKQQLSNTTTHAIELGIDAAQAVVDLCNILEYATAGLGNLLERRDAKGMRETASSVIKNIKEQMEEFNKNHPKKEA